MSDRALQDEIIHALADAPYRHSAAWRERELADPDRVERFARFLARRFYYERVIHFFRYSRALARVTGRRPEAALRGDAFEALLSSVVLGDRQAASAVAGVVADYVRTAEGGQAILYLDDLLRYETAMMIVESGPRMWSGSEPGPASGVSSDVAPTLAEGTIVLELGHDVPGVLPSLMRPWTVPPPAPPGPCQLIVARTRRGRVTVARLSDPIASAFLRADGHATIEDLAMGSGADIGALREAVTSLAEIGAVRFSVGS